MSDQNSQSSQNLQNQEDEGSTDRSEIEMLRQRARLMGITFSGNTGLETLRKKVQDRIDGNTEDPAETEAQSVGSVQANPFTLGEERTDAPVQTLQQKLHDECMKLIRVRITNMDPKKKDLQGEIMTVANEFIGTVKKFIPFGEHTENGYHVPKILVDMMEARRFLHIRVTRDARTGVEQVHDSWAKEFAIEYLPPLTERELDDLKQAQLAAGSIERNLA